MSDKSEKLIKRLYEVAKLQAGKIDSDIMKYYIKTLEPYSLAEINAALIAWVRESSFVPRPNEIIEIIIEQRREANTEPDVPTSETPYYRELREHTDWDRNIENIRKINSKLN